MRPLVWFRSDLRIADNAALARAARDATRGVIAVFLLSPDQWREHEDAPVKIDLILRSLQALSTSLQKLNIPLLIGEAPRFADAPQELLRIAKAHQCDAIYFNREYELNESRRDAALERAFKHAGHNVHTFDDQVLASPGAIRTQEGRFYTVFTPFKRTLIARLTEAGVPAPHPAPKPQSSMACSPSLVPSSIDGFESAIDPSLWPAGESHARDRLSAFGASRIASYKNQRDFPAIDGTSALSPYLAVGCISIRQCLHAAVEANHDSRAPLESGNPGATCWISELIWREFYIHILHGFPRVCMHRPFQPATDSIRWNDNHDHFNAWCEGRTGVPIVDAGMRQLARTGWMHNRVRMIVAMYLAKNLFLDWRHGERHFMRHLVDGFLASNNGGWQWSASTGTDAAPYFRIFNPISQSLRFDPEGTYIRRFVPELASLSNDAIHDPSALPELARARLEYPEMLVDLSRSRAAAIEAFRAIK
jgi:deoxyribodipyrimidine photo-lyase